MPRGSKDRNGTTGRSRVRSVAGCVSRPGQVTVGLRPETRAALTEFCRARGFKVGVVVDRVLSEALSDRDDLAQRLVTVS